MEVIFATPSRILLEFITIHSLKIHSCLDLRMLLSTIILLLQRLIFKEYWMFIWEIGNKLYSKLKLKLIKSKLLFNQALIQYKARLLLSLLPQVCHQETLSPLILNQLTRWLHQLELILNQLFKAIPKFKNNKSNKLALLQINRLANPSNSLVYFLLIINNPVNLPSL